MKRGAVAYGHTLLYVWYGSCHPTKHDIMDKVRRGPKLVDT